MHLFYIKHPKNQVLQFKCPPDKCCNMLIYWMNGCQIISIISWQISLKEWNKRSNNFIYASTIIVGNRLQTNLNKNSQLHSQLEIWFFGIIWETFLNTLLGLAKAGNPEARPEKPIRVKQYFLHLVRIQQQLIKL